MKISSGQLVASVHLSSGSSACHIAHNRAHQTNPGRMQLARRNLKASDPLRKIPLIVLTRVSDLDDPCACRRWIILLQLSLRLIYHKLHSKSTILHRFSNASAGPAAVAGLMPASVSGCSPCRIPKEMSANIATLVSRITCLSSRQVVTPHLALKQVPNRRLIALTGFVYDRLARVLVNNQPSVVRDLNE